jgi:hypothetical protein
VIGEVEIGRDGETMLEFERGVEQAAGIGGGDANGIAGAVDAEGFGSAQRGVDCERDAAIEAEGAETVGGVLLARRGGGGGDDFRGR